MRNSPPAHDSPTESAIRSALDRQVFLDYCQWEAQEKAQFKGLQTYFPRMDAKYTPMQ
jgi:hypothetical protein